MKTHIVRFFITLSLNLALCLCFLGTTVCAQIKSSGSPSDKLKGRVGKAKDDVIRAANEYKAGLEKLLIFQEADVKSAAEMVEKRKQLLAQSIISDKAVDEGERLLLAAKARVEETKKQMAEADNLIKEALAEEKLSPMPQLKQRAKINSQKKAPLKKNQPAKRARTCKGCMVI